MHALLAAAAVTYPQHTVSVFDYDWRYLAAMVAAAAIPGFTALITTMITRRQDRRDALATREAAESAAKHASEANDAVNHRPEDKPRLYEMVQALYDANLTQDHRAERIEGKVDDLTDRVGDLETAVYQEG